MKYFIYLAILLSALISYAFQDRDQQEWILILKQKGKPDFEIAHIPKSLSKPFVIEKKMNAVKISVYIQPFKNYISFTVTASMDSGSANLYFSLSKKYGDQIPYNFNGAVQKPEIYRQSPHDVNAWIANEIAMQAIPVVALKNDSEYEVALCGSPYLYDNFTSQSFYPAEKRVELSSGDNGGTPGLHPISLPGKKESYNREKSQILSPGKIIAGYHLVTPNKPHVFNGIIFNCKSGSLAGLRKEMNQRAAVYFSNGKYTDYFGSLSFITAYMNLRRNETGKSQYWVVPSVEYANTQYGRDAFWISTMLSDSMSAECLRNELDSVNHYAEYALLTILWAYRTQESHHPVDLAKLQQYMNAVENHARDGYFYSFDENDGRKDFQYWGDLIAFDTDDVVTYNQGLFALSLHAAMEMGLHIKTDPGIALKNYQDLYNPAGFYPISKKKNRLVGPDPVLPDLLSKLYFNRFMLPEDRINKHYQLLMKRLKTKYGFKVIAQQNGAYLKSDEYDLPGYKSQANKGNISDGQYFRGGSFYLYDALFLMDAYLHGISGSEDVLIWRTSLDFSSGGTTFECLNTMTGEPWKPNMGWNVAVYAYWRKLMEQGKAGNRLFRTIDSLSGQLNH